MGKERISEVKKHFDQEAGAWDQRVLTRVPYYKEMLNCLVSALTFAAEKPINVLDLGTGTGTIPFLIKTKFPKAKITCMDISAQMLDTAKIKLSNFSDISFEQGNLTDYKFKEQYDAVVSSLALHHLEPNQDKINFYKNLFNALNPEGIFINADIILADDEQTQELFLKKWGEFVLSNLPNEDMQENLQRYYREDRPNKLSTELTWLKTVGFKSTEIYWKYYNFAVYGAKAKNK